MRQFSNTANVTALTDSVSDADTTIDVGATTGFPVTTPYTLSIDAENASKELVEVTNVAGTTLTVTRGIDGTSAVAHTIGAEVRHDHSARDFREPQEHIAATSDVHGVTGEFADTDSAQALTNKNLSDPSNTFPSSLATRTGTETLTNKTIALGSNTISGTLAQFNTALSDGDFATLAVAQTLTNKTIALGSNTVSGSLAEFNAALTGDDFVGLAATQTLTNKTLTAPTLTAPVVTGGADITGGLDVDSIVLAGEEIGVYDDYVPTVDGVDATVNFAKVSRVGPNHMVGTVIITFTDEPDGDVSITLPAATEIAFAKPVVVGSAGILDETTQLMWTLTPAVYNGFGDDVVFFSYSDAGSSSAYLGAGQGWEPDDILTVQFSFPVAP